MQRKRGNNKGLSVQELRAAEKILFGGCRLMKTNIKLIVGFLIVSLVTALTGLFIHSIIPTLLVSTAFSLILGAIISETIIIPIKKLMEVTNKLSAGNTDIDFKDLPDVEKGSLTHALHNLIITMHEQALWIEKIAEGDLSFDIPEKEESNALSCNIKKAAGSIRKLAEDVEVLKQSTAEDDLSSRADISGYKGIYKNIINCVNDALGNMTEKESLYEGIIDAVPLPIHVTDNNMNWIYLNKAFEKLMVEQGVIKDRKSGYGKPCCSANANICNTEKCGIRQLQKGTNESYFDWCGMNCKQDTSYLYDYKGEKKGYVEVVTDLTSILRVNKYTKNEVENLARNLDLLASGNLNFNLELEEADKYTEETRKTFMGINSNFEKARGAIKKLIDDILNLSDAAINGSLSTRADNSKHEGEYGKIIEGINNTLNAVVAPVQEAAKVLNEMSKGNLQVSVKGNYKGDHAEIKNALNDTIVILSSYINEISSVLTEMAKGNLVVKITKDYRGDFVQIKDSLNNIIKEFNDILNEVNNSAVQVSSGAKQVSDSSQMLSQGATEQASSVEELTASMEEIAAQTKLNAANADNANKLALTVREDAAAGNEHMKEMLKSMDEINEASTNISKIIKVIDDIAFQTNILALNAAVEAARAGQYGKGFAVVAEEVRNLAAKSANAAKDTTILIESSIQKVGSGMKMANETAAALKGIVEGVTKAADLVGEIAKASNEQAAGITQVNQGIGQVSEVTQANSATSEEGAAASEELSSQAELLREKVGRFNLQKTEKDDTDGLSPEILKLLKDMSEKKNSRNSRDEAAAAVLSSNCGEYGKY